MYSPTSDENDWVVIDRQEDTEVAVKADSGEDSMSEFDLDVAVEMELRSKQILNDFGDQEP
jgi:hypothetical protein